MLKVETNSAKYVAVPQEKAGSCEGCELSDVESLIECNAVRSSYRCEQEGTILKPMPESDPERLEIWVNAIRFPELPDFENDEFATVAKSFIGLIENMKQGVGAINTPVTGCDSFIAQAAKDYDLSYREVKQIYDACNGRAEFYAKLEEYLKTQ